MLTVNIVCVGNLKEKFWIDAQNEYAKRLSKFCKLNIIELFEQNKFEDTEKILQIEGEDIIKHLNGKCILLDICGKESSSEEFARQMQNISLTCSVITFVIGSSYGVSKDVKDKIKDRLSFGRATYPHNLARIILLEQVYRCFMINSGSKYHKWLKQIEKEWAKKCATEYNY